MDCLFEALSGFTTTGASVLTEIESLPKGILFWRSLTHWLGGMGIIVLTIAILPFLGVGGMQLFKAEVPGPVADKLKPRITETAKLLWQVYLLFTAAEVLLLKLGGMSLFDSFCHTFGTLATGGFSTKNASIGHYNSAYFDVVITIFMLLSGINFALHYQALTGNLKAFYRNSELRFFLVVFLVATVMLTWSVFSAGLYTLPYQRTARRLSSGIHCDYHRVRHGGLRSLALALPGRFDAPDIHWRVGRVDRRQHQVRSDHAAVQARLPRVETAHPSQGRYSGQAWRRNHKRRRAAFGLGIFYPVYGSVRGGRRDSVRHGRGSGDIVYGRGRHNR
jgi:hypothetical protein